MAKKKDAASDAEPGRSYLLGPQEDGSIILRIPSDFDLMVMRKAVEKQEKNSQAAGGTISALAEGEDPFLDRVQRSLTKLKATISNARAPENQVADTPIGKEIARNKAEQAKGEQIDGHVEGVFWAPHVPAPRPKLGDPIRWPKGESVSVASIMGFDDRAAAFSVKGADDVLYLVVAHEAGTGTEWRINGQEYSTPTIAPKMMSAGDELQEAVADDDRLLRDAPSSEVDDDSGASAATPAPRPKTTRKAASSQRERNQRSAGVKPRPITPVPKPGAAKKGGKRK